MSPREEHPRNQVDAATQPDAACADNGTCAESNWDEAGRCGCRSRRPGPGAGPARGRGENRGGDLRCPTSPGPRSTPVSGAGHDPGNARPAVTSIGAGVRRAPRRHRAGFGRSLSGDPFFDPAGPRALHRRGGRGAARARRHARAGDPVGARGQPRPRPPWEGRRRSVSRPGAHDAATYAGEHGLRAAQLPQAPPRSRGRRSAKLGSAFFGVASRPAGHGRRACNGPPTDLDGARRMATRGRAVAGGRTPGCRAPTAPDLIARMLHQPERSPGRGERRLNAQAVRRSGRCRW